MPTPVEIAEFLLSKYDLQNYNLKEQEMIQVYSKKPPSDAVKAFFENEKTKFQEECEDAAGRYWPTQKPEAYKAIVSYITTHLKGDFKTAMLRRAIVSFYYAASAATILSVEDRRRNITLPRDVNEQIVKYFDDGWMLFPDQDDWDGVLCD